MTRYIFVFLRPFSAGQWVRQELNLIYCERRYLLSNSKLCRRTHGSRTVRCTTNQLLIMIRSPEPWGHRTSSPREVASKP